MEGSPWGPIEPLWLALERSQAARLPGRQLAGLRGRTPPTQSGYCPSRARRGLGLLGQTVGRIALGQKSQVLEGGRRGDLLQECQATHGACIGDDGDLGLLGQVGEQLFDLVACLLGKVLIQSLSQRVLSGCADGEQVAIGRLARFKIVAIECGDQGVDALG